MLPTLLALTLAAPDPAAIDTLVREAQRVWNVPGVAVAIVKADEVIYLKGHGSRGHGLPQPMTAQTLFPLSSCTKGFTATLLAQLVDEGKLDWDDPVRKHVPGFHLSDPLADADVRLRDLLCHRTGVATNAYLWYRAPWTRAELIRRIGLVPLSKPFRTTFQYQNTMWVVAGQAAENAGGKPWEHLLRERLLKPLGMTQTLTHAENVPEAKLARGHRMGVDGLEPVPVYLIDRPDPAVSVLSNAADLARWLQFHLRGGTVDGKPLVKKATLEVTRTPQIVLPLAGLERDLHPETVQASYGMGWVLQDYRGRPLASHAGVLDGFRVHLTLAPRDGIGIVLLANLERTRMHLALSNALLDHVLGLEKRDWNRTLLEAVEHAAQATPEPTRPQTGTRAHRPLKTYAGRYENAAYGTITILATGASLRWSYHRFNAALEHVDLDTFRLREPIFENPQLRFHAAGDGSIASLEMLGGFGTTFRRVAE